jgi:MFS family permease
VPGLVAVAILVLGVREPARRVEDDAPRAPIRWRELGVLRPVFWGVVALGAVLTLARFSEAFLILRAADKGVPLAYVPSVMVVMNVIYAASAYPMGALSDKADKRFIAAGGFAVLILADIILALAPNGWVVMAGAGLWGLHMGMTQGLLSTLVAETAPASLRGTAFGLFHLITGIALLAASIIAGALWSWIGPSATFIGGAAFTAIGLLGFAAFWRDTQA